MNLPTKLTPPDNPETLTPWSREVPPENGWYNASTDRDAGCRRFWHGTHWSAPVFVGDPDGHADRARATRGESQFAEVEWRGLTAPRKP